MGVVAERALIRCQRIAMAVCTIGMLFCWGKSAIQLHEPRLLLGSATETIRALLASSILINDRVSPIRHVDGGFPTALLRPSGYGATIISPASLGGAWNVLLEGAAFECRAYRTVLGTYSYSEVLLRSVRAIAGRMCPGAYSSTSNVGPDGPLDR